MIINLEEWLTAIASNENLRGEDYKVMFLLLANVDYVIAEISLAEIALKLNMKVPNVCRAIKRLEGEKIIEKRYTGKKLCGYKFLGLLEA